jgi:asparagine synthase (glutamine-hydrolysing)
MCGCVGVIDLTGRLGTDRMAAVVRAMADLQHHRGPDDGGVWVAPDGRAALGHRRLAIIDLSPEGRQPMQAPGCRSVVVYNGEIYNFARLRRRLEARGCQFVSRCDTEILPHLFDTLGPGGPGELGGDVRVWSVA